MRHDPKSLRLVTLTVLAAGLLLGGCSGFNQHAELRQRQFRHSAAAAAGRRRRDALQIRGGGIRRPLGLHVLPKGSGSGADHQHGARAVQVALCDRQGAGRWRHDASGRRTPADRIAAQGQPDGKNYIGPDGDAGVPQDREIVSFDGRVLVTRYVDPDAANRYGNMVYVRCAPRAAVRSPQARSGGMTVTIWHNPKCANLAQGFGARSAPRASSRISSNTSRIPPSAAEIRAALKEMGIGPRELLRRRGSPYDDLGLGKPKWTDAELVAAMAKHPLLIERPVVRTRKGTRLCRPPDRLKEIL